MTGTQNSRIIELWELEPRVEEKPLAAPLSSGNQQLGQSCEAQSRDARSPGEARSMRFQTKLWPQRSLSERGKGYEGLLTAELPAPVGLRKHHHSLSGGHRANRLGFPLRCLSQHSFLLYPLTSARTIYSVRLGTGNVLSGEHFIL